MSLAKKTEAIDRLKDWIEEGQTIYCILRNVSRSGMSRRIDFYTFGKMGKMFLTPSIADALGYSYTQQNWRNQEGLRVNGCGMDMGFAVVNDLAHTLGRKLRHEWL